MDIDAIDSAITDGCLEIPDVKMVDADVDKIIDQLADSRRVTSTGKNSNKEELWVLGGNTSIKATLANVTEKNYGPIAKNKKPTEILLAADPKHNSTFEARTMEGTRLPNIITHELREFVGT